MVDTSKPTTVAVPSQRTAATGEPDHRPRFLRWLLPTACATAVPLDPAQQAELKLIAYH